ncbi:MAG: peptide chain release factor N(5)-glutamine methyltransferase [Bryobacterales bacterium]|nr:peptide chain release factor N(5)-glutamine methyltransferase [Bryobacterales bacterium]
MTVRTAIRQASSLLEEAGTPAARLTAEVLLCHALDRERAWLFGHPEEELSDAERARFGRALHERLGGKPTQYITGRQEFYGREFAVSPDVLIPRPETEHVVETALAMQDGVRRVVDAGCGSGALAVTLRLEMDAEVWGTDISPAALKVAAANARRLQAPVHFLACDLTAAIGSQTVDLLVSNPPYVAHADYAGLQREVRDWEPHVALFAGETGLEMYARLVGEARRVLRPGGALVLELGFKTYGRVREMFGSPWRDIRVVPDLAGIPRVVAARLP